MATPPWPPPGGEERRPPSPAPSAAFSYADLGEAPDSAAASRMGPGRRMDWAPAVLGLAAGEGGAARLLGELLGMVAAGSVARTVRGTWIWCP